MNKTSNYNLKKLPPPKERSQKPLWTWAGIGKSSPFPMDTLCEAIFNIIIITIIIIIVIIIINNFIMIID